MAAVVSAGIPAVVENVTEVASASIPAVVKNGTEMALPGYSGVVVGLLSDYFSGWSYWQMAVTVLLVLMTYDQCMSTAKRPSRR